MLNKPKKRTYPTHHNIIKPTVFKWKTIILKAQFALISCENGILTAAQISAAILSLKRSIKQNIKLITHVFPHLPVTKRPLEMPLGKGKSNVSHWVTPVKAGSIIFELNTDQVILSKSALIAASYKLPIKTQIIRKL